MKGGREGLSSAVPPLVALIGDGGLTYAHCLHLMRQRAGKQ